MNNIVALCLGGVSVNPSNDESPGLNDMFKGTDNTCVFSIIMN